MVSFKSLTLLTLSASIATAVPQYGHARFHYRAVTGADLTPLPTGPKEPHHHHHHHNETETGAIVDDEETTAQKPNGLAAEVSPCSTLSTHTEYVTSTDIATVTAPARRWNNPNTWTYGGQNTWTYGGQNTWTYGGQNTWTQPAAQSSTAPLVGVSVGVSVGGSAPTTTASGSVATASVASGASSGGKKGLSYNSPSILSQFSGAGASWAYNWGSSSGGTLPSGVEYVPMLWGSDGIAAWPAAVSAAIANGATHVLSFNEPDFPQQANIAADQAAQLHIANVANLAGQVKIVSPAITNSNVAGQGLDWLTSFLAACGGAANNCKLDAVACHWYNNPGTFSDFQSHISAVINLANQNNVPKVWITEFAVNGGTSDQADFLQQALPYLDSLPQVERYAYFMAGEGQMLSGGALNAVGNAYVA